MKLESTTVSIDKSAQEVFNFLTNVENFEQLMPDKVHVKSVYGLYSFVHCLLSIPSCAEFFCLGLACGTVE